jgi:hypothetical protein
MHKYYMINYSIAQSEMPNYYATVFFKNLEYISKNIIVIFVHIILNLSTMWKWLEI